MRYNSNKSNRPTVGNELPYSGQPGNPKINKQLKQLEEDINNVAGRLNGYVGEDDSEINGMIGDALDGIRDDVEGLETVNANLIPRLDNLENTVGGFATEIQTAKVTAMDADFDKVIAGKFLFENPPILIPGTNICKINNGSVVYATDGTNSVLVDYTDKDAWVAKAKVEDGEHFSIYSNGVLTFTQSGGWSVYVIGNDFDTDDLSIPQVLVESSEDTPSYVNETPVNMETGVTIGGTLYAALARDYTFDSIEVTSATINSATVSVLNATNASIDAITTGNVIAQDAVVTDANIEHLNNSERNLTGYVDVPTHAAEDNIYIKLNKFTGTYYLKLVNGSETIFTATVVWNGTNPIVNYFENITDSEHDCLYKLILTDHGLYFVTNNYGRLFYGWDSFNAVAPESSYYIDEGETFICDYLVKYASRTVFLGNHSVASGMDVLGEVVADSFSTPEDKPGFDFRGDATLATLPLAADVGAGAVYNITEDGYTDNRFVEGAGKPINAGDDVVAVEVTLDGNQQQVEITGIGADEEIDNAHLLSNGDLLVTTKDSTDNSIYNIYLVHNGLATKVWENTDHRFSFYNMFLETTGGTLIATPGYDSWGLPPMYSEDMGHTWAESSDSFSYVGTISLFEHDNIIYWTCKAGSYSSDDFGRTWQSSTLGDNTAVALGDDCFRGKFDYFSGEYKAFLEKAPFSDLSTFTRIDASIGQFPAYTGIMQAGNYIIAGINGMVERGFSTSLYRTTDGENFEEIFEGGGDDIEYRGGKLTIVQHNTSTDEYKFYKSDNFGSSWDELPIEIEIPDPEIFVRRKLKQFFYDGSSDAYYIITYNGVYTFREGTSKVLKWDKFAAGVNYENFVAQNITASTALKSEGTLEVDGATTLNTLEVESTSQFDDDVTVNADLNADKVITPDLEVTGTMTANSTGVDVTKNVTHTGTYTATGNQTITGNLTRTGNETISGLVIIGDLD